MPQDLLIRNFDPLHDTAALMMIDTSFTSDYVYEVAATPNALRLYAKPVAPPRTKHYSMKIDEELWTKAYVAIEDDMICGFMATQLNSWNRRMVIWHFYVDLPRRGRGIGRRMMDHAIESGRRLGASHFWIETSNLNYPGIEAYRRLGYSLCGFDTALYRDTPAEQEFAIYMARSLTGGRKRENGDAAAL